MTGDWRSAVAEFYDLAPHHPDDVPFYLEHVLPGRSRVLELGCGTGRVTLPLAEQARSVVGVDNSEAMIARCRASLAAAGGSVNEVRLHVADIAALEIEGAFDLVIAPFRVLQNLATDDEVAGLFSGIRAHLAPGGTCILNTFRPFGDREAMVRTWVSDEEKLSWEVEDGDTVVRCYDRRSRLQQEPLVVFPTLVYRRYRADDLIAEAQLDIAMRCYYPDEFVARVESHGFRITGRWGGYAGELYGEGPELILGFTHSENP